MKNLRVEVWFKPMLKLMWTGPNPTTTREFDQYRFVEVTDTLVVKRVFQNRKLVAGHLIEQRTGTVHAVLSGKEAVQIVESVIEDARKRAGKPEPYTIALKPLRKKPVAK
jgi:hypothetical protein